MTSPLFRLNGQHKSRRALIADGIRMDRRAGKISMNEPEREHPELVVHSWWPSLVERHARLGILLTGPSGSAGG